MDNSAFFGFWDLYSGPISGTLMLQPDNRYMLTLYNGAQSWGGWRLDNRQDHLCLVMVVSGANPPIQSMMSGQPLEDVHAIMSVQPNQIQLYDSVLIRRFVPQQSSAQPMQNQAAYPLQNNQPGGLAAQPFQFPATPPANFKPDFTASMPSAPTASLGRLTIPCPPSVLPVAFSKAMLPDPTYSAPPLPPQPTAHVTPAMAQMAKDQNDINNQVRAIYAQIALDDRTTQIGIDTANASIATSEFRAQQIAGQEQSKAVHDMADRFTVQVIRGGRPF